MSDCAKVRYRTELDAKIALASTNASARKRRGETAYYRCPQCKGWHLTSSGRR